MRKPIILSGRQDPDLLALYETLGRKEFVKLVKDSLRRLVRAGYKSKVMLPETVPSHLGDKAERIQIGLTFSDAKDADVTYLLDQCQKGMCGQLIKQAIRFHVGAMLTLPAFLSSEFCETLVCQNPMQVLFAIGDSPAPVRVQTVRKPATKQGATEKINKQKENRPEPVPETAPSFGGGGIPSFGGPSIPSFGGESEGGPQMPASPSFNETPKVNTPEDDDDYFLKLLENVIGD